MYEISISNDNGTTWQKVHEMNDLSDRRVKACTFSRGVSMIHAADFQVLATNPTYTYYHEHTTLVRITNTKTGNLAFDGFVAKVYDDGMDSSGVVQKSVSCDGCLAWLNDTIQMYRKFDNIPIGEVLFGNVQGRPVGLLTEHNAHVPEYKRIYQGTNDYSGNLSFECKYESTLECIKKNILDALQGAEISITRDGNGRLILNITNGAKATKLNTPIQLADNMVSMALETDASNIVTRLVPLGAYIEVEQQVSGKTKKVRTNQRFDIHAAPAVEPTSTDPVRHTANSVYIDDTNAIAQYGVIVGTVVFDDLVIRSDHQSDDAAVIMAAGKTYLLNNNRIKKSYKAEVLDLSTIDLADNELKEGYVYRFVNSMIPIDDDLRIQKITVDIFAAHKPTIEIGDKAEKITDVGAKQAKLIEYELPEKQAEFLDAAQATATASIANATQGQVYIEEGDYDQQIPGEILIMDNPDKASASKVWRWNLGGFGYSPNGYNGPYINALTVDGTAVHKFLMTEDILAENLTITGGKISINSSSETYDAINLNSGGWHSMYTPLEVVLSNDGINKSITIQAAAMFFRNGNDSSQIYKEWIDSRSDVTNSWKSSIDSWKSSIDSWKSDHSTATNVWAQGIGVMLNEHDSKINALWNAVFPS